MEPESDASLLGRIRAGNRNALAELYERYKQPLYVFCYRLLKDRGKAEDAVHEVFLKLHDGTGRLTNPEYVRFWLFSVARNEVYMNLRSNGRTTTGVEDTVWDEQTPLSVLAEKEQSIMLESVLGAMRAEYREVLLLREYEGLTYAQIATVTGDSESSVKSRLFKARKALATRLSPLMKERKQ